MRWGILAALLVLMLTGICFGEWEHTYSELGFDIAYSAVQTPDSGFIVTGYTAFRNPSVWLFKLDPSGDMIWSRVYSDSLKQSTGYSVIMAVPDDGMPDGYIIAGSKGSESYASDIYVLRTDLNGDTIWTREWGADWCRYVTYIDDAYLIAGHGGGDNDATIIKFTDSGDTLWSKSYGVPDGFPDVAFSIVPAANDEDGYVFAGYKLIADPHTHDAIWVVRLDSDGNMLWDHTYGGTDGGIGYSIIQSGDGYVITGRTENWEAFVLKIDDLGNEIWNYTYPGVLGQTIIEDSDGGYVIAGYSYCYEFGQDVWIYKIDSDGYFLWEKTYNYNNNNDNAWTIAPTFTGEYIIAGYSYYNPQNPDAYVILTDSEHTSIDETQAPKPEALTLSVYPNPFNSSVVISAPEGAKIKIYDLIGRLIHEIPEAIYDPSTTIWQPDKAIGSGVYFVRAEAGDKSIMKRVVYLK